MATWKLDAGAVVSGSVNVARVLVTDVPDVAVTEVEAVAAMGWSPTATVKTWESGPPFRVEPVPVSVTLAVKWSRPVKPGFGVIVNWPVEFDGETVAFASPGASVMV